MCRLESVSSGCFRCHFQISLTLSDKLGDFDGGVILSENGVDKNFTFEIEVALLKEQTEANVAKEIFG